MTFENDEILDEYYATTCLNVKKILLMSLCLSVIIAGQMN